MLSKTIDVTYAQQHFQEILNQVNTQATSFYLTTNNQVIARILPAVTVKQKSLEVTELNQFFSQLPSLEDEGLTLLQDIQATRNQLKISEESWD